MERFSRFRVHFSKLLSVKRCTKHVLQTSVTEGLFVNMTFENLDLKFFENILKNIHISNISVFYVACRYFILINRQYTGSRFADIDDSAFTVFACSHRFSLFRCFQSLWPIPHLKMKWIRCSWIVRVLNCLRTPIAAWLCQETWTGGHLLQLLLSKERVKISLNWWAWKPTRVQTDSFAQSTAFCKDYSLGFMEKLESLTVNWHV